MEGSGLEGRTSTFGGSDRGEELSLQRGNVLSEKWPDRDQVPVPGGL